MKRVLVTGGARGIGLEISRSFLNDESYFVVISDLNLPNLQEEKTILDHSDRVDCVQMDVSSERSVYCAIEEINRKHGGIDILVNNAGISPKHDGKALKLDELTLDEWEQVIKVNLTGAFLCTRAVIGHMKENRWGRIINIASQSARTATTIAGIHYGASKTGLLGFSRALARQFGEYNITSNCLAPGRIESNMTQGVPDEINQQFIEKIPIKRMGTGKEIGETAKFLASEEAGYITGTVVDINGGSFIG